MSGGFGGSHSGGGHWGGGSGGSGSGTLQNLGFEVADVAGNAAHWSQVSLSSWGLWAAYLAAGSLVAGESFEASWSSNEQYVFAFVDADPNLQAAHYSATLFTPPLLAEAFEAGWSHNEHFFTTSADFVSAGVESFESGWNNDTWGSFTLSAALFAAGAKTAETFEDHWRSNEAFVSDWASVTPGVALFSGVRALTAETFEFVKPDASFVVGGSGEIVQFLHGVAVDYRVSFYVGSGGVFPTGLDPTATYWVVAVLDFQRFTVALTQGGSPISPSGGSGVNYLHAATEFWTVETTTI